MGALELLGPPSSGAREKKLGKTFRKIIKIVRLRNDLYCVEWDVKL